MRSECIRRGCSRGGLRLSLLALALALASLPAVGAIDAIDAIDGASTIRASDIPQDAPRFQDHPAQQYAGVNAAPDVMSDARSRRYRTQLKNWAREKPNFAGHSILATWGCGTGCTEIAIIDAIRGKVFHPPGVRSNHIEGVDPEVLLENETREPRADFGALHYRADSRLLILFGSPEGRAENRGISYFLWENDQLRRIRFVRKAPSAISR